MNNIIYTIIAISLCLVAGKLINSTVSGLPASLYGMMLYCLFLQLGWLAPNKVDKVNQWVIKHMGLCFIPATMGVMDHFELLKNHGYSLVIIIVFTTFLLISFVGLLAEKYLNTTPKPTSFKKNV